MDIAIGIAYTIHTHTLGGYKPNYMQSNLSAICYIHIQSFEMLTTWSHNNDSKKQKKYIEIAMESEKDPIDHCEQDMHIRYVNFAI